VLPEFTWLMAPAMGALRIGDPARHCLATFRHLVDVWGPTAGSLLARVRPRAGSGTRASHEFAVNSSRPYRRDGEDDYY
jgi:hypothetical protein